MGCRCLHGLLLVLGCALLVAALFPVFGLLRLDETWRPAFMAAKLLVMLPVGALCLFGAASLSGRLRRR